ncbi:MAG: family 78 glycoside hydrolase catalytic domain [Rikenellaceae bacterium]
MNLKLFVLLFVASIFTLVAQAKPTRLRVDYIRVPEQTLINNETPSFAWIVAQKAEFQSAYQIIVSTSPKCKIANMWDSGKVEGDNNYAVLYSGSALEEEQTYYWKVRYWDANGRPSKYSEIQKFTLASREQLDQSIITRNPILKREDKVIEQRQIDEGEYHFDFGKAAFGSLRLKINAQKDSQLLIRLGEQLNQEGLIEQNPKGTIRYQELYLDVKEGVHTYNVELKADKRNTSAKAIPIPDEWGVIMPFRYVEVAGASEDSIKDINPIRIVWYGYREELGEFESSNKLLDSIWNICQYTIQATDFLGYYIDGDRERIPYEADTYINQLCHYGVDSEYAIGKSSLEYYMSNATWPTEWLLHTIMIAYQDYIYTGDVRIITKYYDKLKAKTLYEIGGEDGLINAKSEAVTPEYLLSIGFPEGSKRMEDIVDWPKAAFTKGVQEMGERDGHQMVPINTVVNAFHYYAVELMSQLAEVVGNDEDHQLFSELSQRIKHSINTKLFDTQKGIYIDGEGATHSSLHSNMLPLSVGLVEQENIASVVEFIKSRGMACSVYGAQYLFEALYAAGEAQYALDLMTNRSDRGWYNMIRIGSTMTLEAWDIKYKGNLDWNHAWGAAPANLIPRNMWGITPMSVGFRSAHIKPQLANLTHSKISVPTLQGEIYAEYHCKGEEKYYRIVIPANMSAIFELCDNDTSISVNGKELDGRQATLLPGQNLIVIK